jgi:hypothetical protein
MKSTSMLAALLLATVATPAMADPILSVIPQGIQAGNWVWEVDITPDLVAAGGSTPIGTELGFRLSGDPLVSITNLSPLVFDTNNPGNPIFGWETPYGSPSLPEGIEANCAACTVINLAPLGGHAATVVPGTTNETFTAMGSGIVSTPGAIQYLKIIALGPGTGGPSTSIIQWLGSFGGKGEIAQIVGRNAQAFTYAGTATQSVPEPGTLFLAATGIALVASGRRRARSL